MFEWLLIGLAAVWAGLINSVVGSGTLVTFPTLVWFGYPPLVANISNNLGLIPGALTAFVGTRSHITQRHLMRRLLPWSLVGGVVGAIALVELPERVFANVVPFFILAGVILVLLGPMITKRREHRPVAIPLLGLAVALAGIYGGYFGAAQGVILLGVLTGIGSLALHEANAIKNALVGLVNGIAGLIFIFSEHVDWQIVFVVAIGSTVGAWIGARYGRHLPLPLYRAIIVAIGSISAFWFFAR